MQNIVSLFGVIAALLSGIFSNAQTLGAQLISLGQKLLSKIESVRQELSTTITRTKNEMQADVRRVDESLSSYKFDVQQQFGTVSRQFDNVPNQISQAANGAVNNAKIYTDGRIAEIKLAAQNGMQGFIPIMVALGSTHVLDAKDEKIAPFLRNGGQYILDVDVVDPKSGETIDGEIALVIGETEYKVENDEKVIVAYDDEKGAFNYVTRDDNYTTKVLQGFSTSLDGLRQVAEAAKNQSDNIKAQVEEFLAGI